jgi:hypothetical protein
MAAVAVLVAGTSVAAGAASTTTSHDQSGGSPATSWAVPSDLGGTAEVCASCPVYGGPFCTYPWYAFNSASGAITFGADYTGTKHDYGQGSQFPTAMQCGGPFGAGSTFCDTVLNPSP